MWFKSFWCSNGVLMKDPSKASDFLNYELQIFLLEFLTYRSLRPAKSIFDLRFEKGAK